MITVEYVGLFGNWNIKIPEFMKRKVQIEEEKERRKNYVSFL